MNTDTPLTKHYEFAEELTRAYQSIISSTVDPDVFDADFTSEKPIESSRDYSLELETFINLSESPSFHHQQPIGTYNAHDEIETALEVKSSTMIS